MSKPYFIFPFCNYPYTFREKIGYAIGKIYCGCIHLVGGSLYAKYFLWNEQYLTEKQITDKKMDELIELKNISSNKQLWHCKSLIFGIFSFMVPLGGILISRNALTFLKDVCFVEKYLSKYAYPFMKWIPFTGIPIHEFYGCQFLQKKYLNFALVISGIFIINNIYGILAHTYNKIRFQRQINILNHGIKIMRAIKAMEADIKNIGGNSQNKFSQQTIESIIYAEILKKKCEWILFYLKDAEENITYVVRNGYYENLFFIFYSEKTAKDFIVELTQLNSSQVDFFHHNNAEANRYQNEFVASRIHNGLIYSYYLHEK